MPPSPSDWLSDDHQVYFLLALVDELDPLATRPPQRFYHPLKPGDPVPIGLRLADEHMVALWG